MSRLPLVRPKALLLVLLLVVLLAGCQKQLPPPGEPSLPAPTLAERLESLKKTVVAGNCAAATPALDEFVRERPDSAEAFLLLGLCQAKQSNPDRAETALSRAASLDPDNPRPLEALGILRYGQKNFPAAKQAFARAVALGSANPQTYYYLGNLAMQAGNCPVALENYRKSMGKDPTFNDASKEYRAAAVACAKPGRVDGKP